MGIDFGNVEILQIVDSISKSKGVPVEGVIGVLEDAIRAAARRKYGDTRSIKVNLDRVTGEISLARTFVVVDSTAMEDSNEEPNEESNEELNEGASGGVNVESNIESNVEPNEESSSAVGMESSNSSYSSSEVVPEPIDMDAALVKDPGAKLGSIIAEDLPPLDLARVTAKAAKHVIDHKIRELGRQEQYKRFQEKIHTIVGGVVEKVDARSVMVKIGNDDAVLYRDQMMPHDSFRNGDRIRTELFKINPMNRGPQLILSRKSDNFVKQLFIQEVPELYDGIVEIRGLARISGIRTKIAVTSNDKSIDAVGSCVGMRGARVQAVTADLGEERVDIVEWSDDLATLIINCLAPAVISKVIIDEDSKSVEIVVTEDQLSVVIGYKGQNVRLTSRIINWNIEVLTEDQESKRRQEEFAKSTELFMRALDVDEILAQLLASESFTSVEDIAGCNIAEIAEIEGIDEGIAEELILRAQDYLAEHTDEADSHPAEGEYEETQSSRNTGPSDALYSFLSGYDTGISDIILNLRFETVAQIAAMEANELTSLSDAILSHSEAERIIDDAKNFGS